MNHDDPNDPVLMYIKEFEHVPPMTRDREVGCAKRILAGGPDVEKAKRELIEANLKLVLAIASEYEGQGLALLDLIQEANVGLMIAVDHFDYTVHESFSIHAAPLIRQRIIGALEEQNA